MLTIMTVTSNPGLNGYTTKRCLSRHLRSGCQCKHIPPSCRALEIRCRTQSSRTITTHEAMTRLAPRAQPFRTNSFTYSVNTGFKPKASSSSPNSTAINELEILEAVETSLDHGVVSGAARLFLFKFHIQESTCCCRPPQMKIHIC